MDNTNSVNKILVKNEKLKMNEKLIIQEVLVKYK
jgi:hypothetical protein